MPALPPVPQMLKIALFGITDNTAEDRWANILHVKYTGSAPTNSDCNSIASTVRSAWSSHMAALCPAPTHLEKVVVTDLTSSTSGQGEDTTAVPGTRGDDSIPANAAFLLSYRINVRYRGGHPRTYLYVLGNADLDGAGDWADAAVAEVFAAFEAFIGVWLGVNFSGCTLSSNLWAVSYISKEENPVPPFRRASPLEIELFDITPQKEMASQRGRIGRRRR